MTPTAAISQALGTSPNALSYFALVQALDGAEQTLAFIRCDEARRAELWLPAPASDGWRGLLAPLGDIQMPLTLRRCGIAGVGDGGTFLQQPLPVPDDRTPFWRPRRPRHKRGKPPAEEERTFAQMEIELRIEPPAPIAPSPLHPPGVTRRRGDQRSAVIDLVVPGDPARSVWSLKT